MQSATSPVLRAWTWSEHSLTDLGTMCPLDILQQKKEEKMLPQVIGSVHNVGAPVRHNNPTAHRSTHQKSKMSGTHTRRARPHRTVVGAVSER